MIELHQGPMIDNTVFLLVKCFYVHTKLLYFINKQLQNVKYKYMEPTLKIGITIAHGGNGTQWNAATHPLAKLPMSEPHKLVVFSLASHHRLDV